MGFFVPARRRGHEILDDASVDTATRVRSIQDVTRSNRLFGGRAAAVGAFSRGTSRGRPLMVLDVGTGLADIPEAIRKKHGGVIVLGLDEAADLLRQASGRLDHAVCGSASALPLRDASVDVVICSQLLHHFADGELGPVIAELDRVAKSLVIVADLRRSWVAAAGFWLASFPLRFHPVTRHDGVVSVLRGFTAGELRAAVRQATGISPRVERRPGFRLTATWTPRTA